MTMIPTKAAMEEVYDVEQLNNDNDNNSRKTRDRGPSDLRVCVNHYFMVLFLSHCICGSWVMHMQPLKGQCHFSATDIYETMVFVTFYSWETK